MKTKQFGQIALGLAVLCGLAAGAHAATYEVDSGGSDDASGLAGTPWKTLQKAANTVAAGDTVLVNDGTYAGFRVRTSGTEASRITFKSKNKGGAKVNSPDPDNDADLITVLSASFITIDGFEVSGSGRAGIGVRTIGDDTGTDTRGDIVQNCLCHDNGLPSGGAHDGIFTGFALNFTAQDNTCYHNGEHGIYISNSADNPIVRRNLCVNNRNCGIQLNADKNTGGGSQDGLISNWLVEANIISGNGDGGGAGINLDGDINGVCRNNLLYNNLATGIALYAIDGAQASNHNVIVNNTVFQPTSTRAALLLMDGANNNVAFNNILYTAEGKPGIEIDAVTDFAHDYNLVSSITGGSLAAHESSPAASTLFVNPSRGDFHSKAGSTAVNTGIGTFGGKNAPATDLEAHARPLGAGFDRGAYEASGEGGTGGGAGTLQFSERAYAVNEGAGTATITVTRLGGSTGAVSVHYATGGGTATPSADYTAKDGLLSWATGDASPKTFTVPIVDDSIVESTETVGLALSSPVGATIGTNSSAILSIVDNDGQEKPRLVLSVSPLSFSEAAGPNAAVGRIIRGGSKVDPLTVTLLNTDATEISVPDTVTIPAGETSATFPVGAVDDTIADGPQFVDLAAKATGYESSKVTITVTDNEAHLAITVTPATFSEGAGEHAATGHVSRNTDTSQPLVVKLYSGDTTEAVVPATVTIPAGATSAEFPVGAVNDNEADGSVRVKIAASATGFETVLTIVTVLDDDARLTLRVTPDLFSEAAGEHAATGVVSRNTPTTEPLRVYLNSNDTSEAVVPPYVIIPAGETSVSFFVGAVDDTIVDGSQSVNITATAGLLLPAVQKLTVTDNDTATRLTLRVTPDLFSEAAGEHAATGVVSRITPGATALKVTLTSSDTTEASVPAFVIIPAGEASVSFFVRAVDDTVVDGSQSVNLYATADGFLPAVQKVTVTDNDTDGKPGPSTVSFSSGAASTELHAVKLIFSGALDPGDADPAHFRVSLHDAPVSITGARLEFSNTGVILTLPEGAVSAGDVIVVSWTGLLDADGKSISDSRTALSVH